MIDRYEVMRTFCDRIYEEINEINHTMGKEKISPTDAKFFGELLDMLKDGCEIMSKEKGYENGISYGISYGYPMHSVVYNDGFYDGGSYNDGMSYARDGRMNQKRNMRGRYSGGDKMEILRAEIERTHDEGTRRELQRVYDMMNQM